MRPFWPKVKRARPLLGTFVEVTLANMPIETANAAISRAFDAVAVVDGLMSFHRYESDVSRLNRAQPNEWVTVHPLTTQVLSAANGLFESSGGVFDIRCGAFLATWGYLPATSPIPGPAVLDETRSRPVDVRGNRARKTGAWLLDLGGIAKGFAVDRAIEALKASGAIAGSVNAGGDLRVFGPREWPVAVRHPANPPETVFLGRWKNRAVATSAAYFSRKKIRGRWRSAIVHTPSRRPFLKRHSVTIVAETCLLADALTKVAALDPRRFGRVASRHGASGFVVDGRGAVRPMN